MAVGETEFLLQSPDATWCADRWEKLPYDGNRYDVIDGVLYISTSPNVIHQWIMNRLLGLVGLPLQSAGFGYAFTSPIGVFMPGCDPVQPDFLMIRSERSSILGEDCIEGVPDLIVEVLSSSHPQLDTTIKRAAYATAGVPEHWIIRPATRDIMIYWQPDRDFGDFAHSRLVAADEVLESPTSPVSQPARDFFAGLPTTPR